VLRAAVFCQFVFCLLQRSAGVTPLKCGEINDINFVANFMENTTPPWHEMQRLLPLVIYRVRTKILDHL